MARKPGYAAEIGKKGEAYAAEWMQKRGYKILARNYNSPYGEVDIIAVTGEMLCFVEVKTRRTNAGMAGSQAVNRKKQCRIIQTALCWMQAHPEQQLQPRFDVCILSVQASETIVFYSYLEGAFDGEAYTGSAHF